MRVCMCVCVCKQTLWSQDMLDLSILRVLEGDEGEDTHLSRTSGTGINTKGRKCSYYIVMSCYIFSIDLC